MNDVITYKNQDFTAIISALNVSDNTKKTYITSMQSYVKYCTSNKLEFGIDSLKQWIFNSNTPRTQALRISAAKRVFSIVYRDHPKLQELQDSISNIKIVKLNNTVKESQYLTSDEVDSLLTVSTPKIAAMIKVLYMTGIRISELLNIRHEDCVYIREGSVVQISIVGKRMKQHTVFISSDLYDEVASVFGGDEFLFSHFGKKYHRAYVTGAISRAGAKIGKNISAHSMRHSFAQKLLGRGVTIDKISKSLCHASISTTANFYLHGSASIEELGVLE
jgi:integrase/recombinase XerD